MKIIDLVPLSKSWLIRMGILDLWYGRDDIVEFLEQHKDELPDDSLALLRVSKAWRAGEIKLDVGEAGFLLRTMRFMAWQSGIDKEFIMHGSLLNRKISNNPEIIHYPLAKLRKLPDEPAETSQWMSAAVLLGNKEKVDNEPFHLKMTRKALEHYKKQRARGLCWEPRYDETILRQTITFIKLLKDEEVSFTAQQAEDYCFAKILGFETPEWPSLPGHESDRPEEVARTLKDIKKGGEIQSKDHRVVQAGAMYQKLHNMPIRVKYPDAVKKSWPQFWRFLENASKVEY